MSDLDLEELESRLYSQIYHDTNDESQENLTESVNNLIIPSSGMKHSTRYFGSRNSGSKYQKTLSSKQNVIKSQPIYNNKSEGIYSKSYSKSHKADISINQVVVVSPKRPIVCLSSKDYWKEKLREKRRRRKLRKKIAAEKYANEEKQLTNDNISTQPTNDDIVITLSDSDEDESCVVLDNKWPVLSLVDSDDDKAVNEENHQECGNELLETNKKLINASSDDVIFVEPVNAPVEIINIDEESQTGSQKNNHETSSASNIIPSKDQEEQQLHQERKELLSTPDSGSNDFMNNSGIELSQKNFNFSLHGSDFNGGEFSKTVKSTENCETESSSSTATLNSINLMKSAVFSEIEFPKDDIFAGGNLERFENLIAPSKHCTASLRTHSTPIKNTKNVNKNVYSSESSESDFENIETDKQTSKNLPELSHFHASPDTSKKEQKQDKQKIKKKKKKNSLRDGESVNVGDITEDEMKQKKRKSNSLGGDNGNVDTTFKKKNKNKKKKTESIVDHLDNKNRENVEFVEHANSTEINKEKTESSSKNNQQNSSLNMIDQQKDENITERDIKKSNETVVEPTIINNSEKNTFESTIDSNILEPEQNSLLEGLLIVDETFSTSQIQVVSSDSESALSALNEEANIQINTEKTSTESTPLHQGTVMNSEFNHNNFNVKDLQLKMSNAPKLWDILDSDRMPPGRARGRRCPKCREIGHGPLQCPNKKLPKCQLCGEAGHYEPRCPNKLCTQCGQKSNYLTNYCSSCFKYRNFRCRLCSMVGHMAEKCPDLWRRYYLTTNEGPLNTYEGPKLKKQDELWCSGCANNGHLEHNCGFFKSLYPPTDPYIKKYDDVYGRRSNSKHENLSSRHHRDDQQKKNQYKIPSLMEINCGINSNINTNNWGGQNYQKYENNYNNNFFNPQFTVINDQMNHVNNQMMLMANQQGFYNNGPQNFYQVPQNIQMADNVQNFNFKNSLPTFINLDASLPQTSSFRENKKINKNEIKPVKRPFFLRRCNIIFNSSPVSSLKHFISEELRKLSKLAIMSKKVIKEMKKKRVPKRLEEKEEYYQTLNMILFGVLNLVNGKMHLERLKQFKMDKNKCGSVSRQKLLKSFLYIFGCSPHEGIDYDDLLRRI